MAKKLWGGRFSKRTDPLVEAYTGSLYYDWLMALYDLQGSIAHAKMLGRCRIVTAAESRKLVQGLTRLQRAVQAGTLRPDPRAEDVHTVVQQALERAIGPVARKLHTARSRNDQVALDLRLYCRDAVGWLTGKTAEVQRALVGLAGRYPGVIIPGYTHLQRAQPIVLAHQLLAYVEMLQRDIERLSDAQARINVMPLGSGALAGTSLPIDRAYVAKLLGFARISTNSMDAVSDRDFAAELLSVLASIAVHLSRLAEDLILWATEEFGLLQLDDAFATGSSLMPQKKNPDVLELIRGQAAFVIGQHTAFLTMLKGLPLTYNRDLQWDKRLLFEPVLSVEESLGVLALLIRSSSVSRSAAQRLTSNDTMCATDVAEYLVGRGVAFADAHAVVGRVVAFAERQGKRLRDVTLPQWQRFSSRFDRGVLAVVDPQRSVSRKRSLGSTNPRQVAAAIRRWRQRLR